MHVLDLQPFGVLEITQSSSCFVLFMQPAENMFRKRFSPCHLNRWHGACCCVRSSEAALTCRSQHVFQVGGVIKNDLITSTVPAPLLLAATHGLQHGVQTPIQSSEVGLCQQGGHAVQGILGKRGPHDIAETILRQRQEAQAKPRGLTDSGEKRKSKKEVFKNKGQDGALNNYTNLD